MGCGSSKPAAEPSRDDQGDAPSADPKEVKVSVEEPGVNEYATQADGKFFAALSSGTMAVIKGQYFLDCLSGGRPFGHRAQIEEKAAHMIFEGKEAARLWLEWGRRFLLVISYCWLSKEHPDPQMFHLPYLKATIEAVKQDNAGEEVGIILDYCSFYQEPRSAEQTKMFRTCLGLINVPYGHPEVTAAKLVSVPATERRSYDDRGWTKFESDVIDSKQAARDEFGERNVLTLDGSLDLSEVAKPALIAMTRNQRRPPVTPARFRSEMQERKQRAKGKNVNLFTNGKDQQFLEKKYEDTFSDMCACVTKMEYSEMNFGVAAAQQLAEVLPQFQKLQELLLGWNELGDEVAQILASGLRNGLVPELKLLQLHSNCIGREGACALARALGDGAAPTLEKLFIDQNNIGDEGACAFAKALADGACPALELLQIDNNNIGLEGAMAVAKALADGAAPGLKDLRIGFNKIGKEGHAALVQVEKDRGGTLYISR